MKKSIWVLLIAIWGLSAQGCMTLNPSMHDADQQMTPHQSHDADDALESE